MIIGAVRWPTLEIGWVLDSGITKQPWKQLELEGAPLRSLCTVTNHTPPSAMGTMINMRR